jgi:tRNA(Ile2) C34 agmatinyltransferase TiaS
MKFSILDQADELRKSRMENYSLEVPYKEEDSCPDCGKETERGFQCSDCIKRYEREIEDRRKEDEEEREVRYQHRQWRNDSGV